MATTFDGLNPVDSRSGEFKMAQIQKIDKYVPRAGTASDPLCVVASADVARSGFSRHRQHALIIESEMFEDR